MHRPNLQTRLTEAFGIHYPIVCAPMALITGGRLAAAIASAGGLGIVGGGYAGTFGGKSDVAQELAHVQGHKFGVGFITWALTRAPHVLDVALEYSPCCAFLSFGDPRSFAERIQYSGARRAAAYAEAISRQDHDIVASVAGECIGLIHDRPNVASIIEAMVTQARSLLERGATLDFRAGTDA